MAFTSLHDHTTTALGFTVTGDLTNCEHTKALSKVQTAMNTRTALAGPDRLRRRAGAIGLESIAMGAKHCKRHPSTSTSTRTPEMMAKARPRTKSYMSKSACAALIIAVAGAPQCVAAGLIQTEAVCQEQFGWMDNSLEQSPCLIAAFLLGACTSGSAYTALDFFPPVPFFVFFWCSFKVFKPGYASVTFLYNNLLTFGNIM